MQHRAAPGPSSVTTGEGSGTVPGAPTIHAVEALNGAAAVTFTAPDEGSSPIVTYEASIDGGAFVALDPSDTTSPITVEGLENGVTQTIAIRAVSDVDLDAAMLDLHLGGTYSVTID